MKKKKNRIILASAISVVSIIAIALVGSAALSPISKDVGADETIYTISFDKNNGAETSDTFTSEEGSTDAYTGYGNEIQLLSSHSKKLDNGFMVLQSGKGYLKNKDDLSGMNSFSITYSFSSENGSARLSFGGHNEGKPLELTGNTEQKTVVFTLADGDFSASAYKFLLFATSGDLNIADIAIKYSCENGFEEYTGVQLVKIKERFLVGDTLSLPSDFRFSACGALGVYDKETADSYVVTGPSGETIDASKALPSSAAGLCSITASYDKLTSNTVQFYVLDPSNKVSATSLTLNNSSIKLSVGGKKTLGYSFAPANTYDTSVTFASNNTSVVTVNSSGLVSAISNGEATITATSSGGLTSSCAVTVEATTGYSRVTSTQVSHDVDTTYAPSGGDEKILIVPIALAGTPKYTWDATTYGQLVSNAATIQDYYANASCGSMNVTVTIAGDLTKMYTSTYTQDDFYTDDENVNRQRRLDLLAQATAWVGSEDGGGINLSDYDNDNNRYVDSIHFMVNGSDKNKWSTNLWPHMDYTYADEPAIGETPVTNVYSLSNIGHISDAYTTVHEQGHIYGLEDYYDYSGSTTDLLGFADMQSIGCFDWNSFSKLQVGWTNPYVPSSSLKSGDSFSVTLNPSATSGDCLVLGTDWSGSAYDEYILIELFTDSGDNKPFWNSWYHPLNKGGVRIYHVDARLWGYNYDSNASDYGVNSGAYDKLVSGSSYDTHQIAANNTLTQSYATIRPDAVNADFHLLELIQKGGFQSNLYNNGYNYLGEDDLFETGDSFSIGSHTDHKDYSSFLRNDGKFNNNNSFNYGIKFTSVTEDSATLTVTLF